MNYTPENNNEAAFEAELFQSLKSYGYLFPENTMQVEAFEKLYGNYAADTPNIKDILSVNSNNSLVDSLDIEMSEAAYSNTNEDLPELPEEKDEAENNDQL